jgi:hypothetical protein
MLDFLLFFKVSFFLFNFNLLQFILIFDFFDIFNMSFIVQKISENLGDFKIGIILLNNADKVIRILFSLK